MKNLFKIFLLATSLTFVSVVVNAENLSVNITDMRAESGLADVVIEVMQLSDGQRAISPLEKSIDQVDKEFISGVTVVPVGSHIRFPNSDDILHHVYSYSTAKAFDIPLYGTGDNLDRFELFDKPGVVEIGCNIHDWMLAYIYVAESELFGKTDAAGTAVIGGLEPGRYTVRIWHARIGGDKPVYREVEVITGTGTELSLTLELVPERRIRRAPSAAGGRYR